MRNANGQAVDTEAQRKAREHYNTRADRRLKGQSQSDITAYHDNGTRRPGVVTLSIRLVHMQMNQRRLRDANCLR